MTNEHQIRCKDNRIPNRTTPYLGDWLFVGSRKPATVWNRYGWNETEMSWISELDMSYEVLTLWAWEESIRILVKSFLRFIGDMPQSIKTMVNQPNGITVGYDAELWCMADALGGICMNAGCKHVVLALIFLKYISDAFEEHRKRLEHESYADLEDPDEYHRGQNVFWMPPKARWECLQKDRKFGVPPLRNANLRLGSAHHPPSCAHRLRRLRSGQRLDVFQSVRRRRDSQKHHRSRPCGLHGRTAGQAVLLHPDPRMSLVPCAG